jgi:hypothetical protein
MQIHAAVLSVARRLYYSFCDPARPQPTICHAAAVDSAQLMNAHETRATVVPIQFAPVGTSFATPLWRVFSPGLQPPVIQKAERLNDEQIQTTVQHARRNGACKECGTVRSIRQQMLLSRRRAPCSRAHQTVDLPASAAAAAQVTGEKGEK